MNDATKCLVCGYTVLIAESEGGVCKDCKPERRARLSDSKNQDGGGGEKPPSSEKQGQLF